MERNEQWKGLGLVPVKSPSIVQKQESHKMFYLFLSNKLQKKNGTSGKTTMRVYELIKHEARQVPACLGLSPQLPVPTPPSWAADLLM